MTSTVEFEKTIEKFFENVDELIQEKTATVRRVKNLKKGGFFENS